jgi:hypothetical protein
VYPERDERAAGSPHLDRGAGNGIDDFSGTIDKQSLWKRADPQERRVAKHLDRQMVKVGCALGIGCIDIDSNDLRPARQADAIFWISGDVPGEKCRIGVREAALLPILESWPLGAGDHRYDGEAVVDDGLGERAKKRAADLGGGDCPGYA